MHQIQTGKGCRLCGAEKEDDEHFLLECGRLEEIRGGSLELQRPRLEDVDEVISLMGQSAKCDKSVTKISILGQISLLRFSNLFPKMTEISLPKCHPVCIWCKEFH